MGPSLRRICAQLHGLGQSCPICCWEITIRTMAYQRLRALLRYRYQAVRKDVLCLLCNSLCYGILLRPICHRNRLRIELARTYKIAPELHQRKPTPPIPELLPWILDTTLPHIANHPPTLTMVVVNKMNSIMPVVSILACRQQQAVPRLGRMTRFRGHLHDG